MNLRKRISELSDDALWNLAIDWAIFERDGEIGDCSLRALARECGQAVPYSSVARWMSDIAFEVFRRLALRSRGYDGN